jgi:hypothetical protein
MLHETLISTTAATAETTASATTTTKTTIKLCDFQTANERYQLNDRHSQRSSANICQ